MSTEKVLFHLSLFQLCCEFLTTKELLNLCSVTSFWNKWIKTNKLFWKNKEFPISSLVQLNDCCISCPIINRISFEHKVHKTNEIYFEHVIKMRLPSFLFPELTSYKILLKTNNSCQTVNYLFSMNLPKLQKMEIVVSPEIQKRRNTSFPFYDISKTMGKFIFFPFFLLSSL